MQSGKAASSSFRTRTSTQQLVLESAQRTGPWVCCPCSGVEPSFASALPQRLASGISVGPQGRCQTGRPSSPWSLVSFAWRIRASSLYCFPVSSAHLAEICSQKIEMPWACQEGVGWRSYRCFWREIWRIGEIIPEHFCFLKEAPAIPPHCTRFHIHSFNT